VKFLKWSGRRASNAPLSALVEAATRSADRLVRLDMSEFQTADSLDRLLTDPVEQSEGAALISSVRRNPFSVVLLDEFEKAHRRIWNVA
jgi:ATP-dependent Clp protease ATP-binding subunit ClpC